MTPGVVSTTQSNIYCPVITHNLKRRLLVKYSSGTFRSFWHGRWTDLAAPTQGPPLSPDLTALDFFLWGFVKDRVYVPPLPANVTELRIRITAAVAELTPEMLRRVWEETEYKWDVSRITNGSHIEP
ncbi:hypothetical protein Cfor_03575 [Coptotermes formosanus]|uniref:Uncharacterized protein n=1 Tax=Coptotermes formosanus TaxID=36987 RepID=A0A6L2PUW4_COPFO|nr:hypothetical protein Cfor_03575 [Coptotermes formosanus]